MGFFFFLQRLAFSSKASTQNVGIATYKSHFVLQAYCSSIGASLIEIYSQTEEDWVKNSFLLPETGGTCSLLPLNLLNLH